MSWLKVHMYYRPELLKLLQLFNYKIISLILYGGPNPGENSFPSQTIGCLHCFYTVFLSIRPIFQKYSFSQYKSYLTLMALQKGEARGLHSGCGLKIES